MIEPATPMWERMAGETTPAYRAFRYYRDLGPSRSLRAAAGVVEGRRLPGHICRWSTQWNWSGRAAAWDDEQWRREDVVRLEAIRTMHDVHQRAGRVAIGKALAALAAVRPENIPAGAIVRLLDVGTRLERETLLHSVDEWQARARRDVVDDPWDAIAREFQDVTSETSAPD